MTQHERAVAFAALHAGEPFVLPNPWDLGSAKLLEGLGYQALATTSAGLAAALGRRDGELTLDQLLDHVGEISAATPLPLSVDLEHGFGPEPSDVAAAIARVAEAGAVGASIEDYDPVAGALYPLDIAVERLAAAVEAARALDFPFTLTGRAENFIRGAPDLDDAIARLAAYEAAGADVLYAPGLRTSDQIRAVGAATGKPLNVLAFPDMTMAELAAAGAQRVSLGSWLATVATRAVTAAAERIRDDGDFSALR